MIKPIKSWRESEMPHRRLSRPTFVCSLLVAVGGLAGCVKKQPADLVLTNGKIITLEEIAPTAEALAVAGDRIVAVVTAKKIKPFIGTSTRVIDLQGQTAIPGFIDSHAHFTGVGEARMILDLTRAKNWDEIVSIVAEAARNAKPGEWIRGRGGHQEKWDKTPEPNVDGLPFHDALSRMTSENPVLLEHDSGHSCLANAKAMELGGITKTTPDPAGGESVRDARGNPIGAFRETAQGLIGRSLYGSELQKTEAERVEEATKGIALAEDG